MDLRSLLAGNRVPLIKSKESWQLSLSSLLTLGTEEDQNEGMDTEGGLLYREYLRMLLFLEKQESCAVRALGIIEQNPAAKAWTGRLPGRYLRKPYGACIRGNPKTRDPI